VSCARRGHRRGDSSSHERTLLCPELVGAPGFLLRRRAISRIHTLGFRAARDPVDLPNAWASTRVLPPRARLPSRITRPGAGALVQASGRPNTDAPVQAPRAEVSRADSNARPTA